MRIASFPRVAATLAIAGGLAACESRPATWEYISPVIFEANCGTSSCHSRAAAVAGLDFSDKKRGYESLMGLSVLVPDEDGQGARARRPLVTPFDPQQSRLVAMLRARNAPRMPPDRPLDEADIRLVEAWILNGALEREPSDARRPSRDARDGGSDAGDATDSTDATDATER